MISTQSVAAVGDSALVPEGDGGEGVAAIAAGGDGAAIDAVIGVAVAAADLLSRLPLLIAAASQSHHKRPPHLRRPVDKRVVLRAARPGESHKCPHIKATSIPEMRTRNYLNPVVFGRIFDVAFVAESENLPS